MQNSKPNKKTINKPIVLDILVDKNCPICKIPLRSNLLSNVEVDYCPKCYGAWFDEDELRLSKDAKDKDLQWLDIDLWKDEKKFKISRGIRICPSCRVPLYEVYYGDSKIIVDVCNLCHGVWLDRAEFKKIINWLKVKADFEVLNRYAKNLTKQATEIFTGPEALKEEISDFWTILKLLNYKLTIQYPFILDIILRMPK